MDRTQAEIEAIRSQLKALRAERDSLTPQEIVPENDSPEAIAQAYRHQAREAARVSTEIEGIDNAIAALEAQLQQKQTELQPLSPQQLQSLSLEEQVALATERAYDHADPINELAAELVEELRALKAIAHELSPSYWQLHHKPFVTGFKGTAVPYVRSDNEVLMIAHLLI
jgi:chromosome segregation ATPase